MVFICLSSRLLFLNACPFFHLQLASNLHLDELVNITNNNLTMIILSELSTNDVIGVMSPPTFDPNVLDVALAIHLNALIVIPSKTIKVKIKIKLSEQCCRVDNLF